MTTWTTDEYATYLAKTANSRKPVVAASIPRPNKTPRPNKFSAVKTTVDGVTYDSLKEAQWFGDLQMMERAGLISNLRRQVRLRIDVNGEHICCYVADATWFENGKEVVADCKSEFTAKNPVYRLKKKLVKAALGITIREVI